MHGASLHGRPLGWTPGSPFAHGELSWPPRPLLVRDEDGTMSYTPTQDEIIQLWRSAQRFIGIGAQLVDASRRVAALELRYAFPLERRATARLETKLLSSAAQFSGYGSVF